MKDSQHEILLPAGLAASYSDGCTFYILNLQSHICVEFLCRREKKRYVSHSIHIQQPQNVFFKINTLLNDKKTFVLIVSYALTSKSIVLNNL